jgi:hypothetical protein
MSVKQQLINSFDIDPEALQHLPALVQKQAFFARLAMNDLPSSGERAETLYEEALMLQHKLSHIREANAKKAELSDPINVASAIIRGHNSKTASGPVGSDARAGSQLILEQMLRDAPVFAAALTFAAE